MNTRRKGIVRQCARCKTEKLVGLKNPRVRDDRFLCGDCVQLLEQEASNLLAKAEGDRVKTTDGHGEVLLGQCVGCVNNKWRGRTVRLFELIVEPDHGKLPVVCQVGEFLVTIGVSREFLDGGVHAVCLEPRKAWDNYIGRFNGVIE